MKISKHCHVRCVSSALACIGQLGVMAAIWLAVPKAAVAEGWLLLEPGPGYRLQWRLGNKPPVISVPRVDHEVLSPLDRWFQVAPGGGAVALFSDATGLTVFTANGAQILRRKDGVTAFRFSAAGDRLALASAKGIEVLTLDRDQPRLLKSLAGVDWLQWTDAGLVARARSHLYLIDDAGNQRTLATLRPGATVAAAKARVVYFSGGSLLTLDLMTGGTTQTTRLVDSEPVRNAEISSDGAHVIFATARRVYLREGSGPVRVLADVEGVQSLFFSSDGASYLWASNMGGSVVLPDGRTVALPPGTCSARFSRNGGDGLVLTTAEGVYTWDARTGVRTIVGGISADDGVNFAGDVSANAGVIAFYYKKTGHQKETDTPRFEPQ